MENFDELKRKQRKLWLKNRQQIKDLHQRRDTMPYEEYEEQLTELRLQQSEIIKANPALHMSDSTQN